MSDLLYSVIDAIIFSVRMIAVTARFELAVRFIGVRDLSRILGYSHFPTSPSIYHCTNSKLIHLLFRTDGSSMYSPSHSENGFPTPVSYPPENNPTIPKI